VNRPVATALIVAAVPLVWALMWSGWRRRGRRQGHLPAPRHPEELVLGSPTTEFDGVYVSTTRHGDWLDRVVAHGLGTRSAVTVRVGTAGVVLDREGARGVAIAREELAGASRASGIAGKVVERDGLAVITWRLGETELDSGVRLKHARDTSRLIAAVNALVVGEVDE
jgi:hypothetical protein